MLPNYFIFLITYLTLSKAERTCCPAERNEISNRKCIDGTNITALPCASKYMGDENDVEMLRLNTKASIDDKYCMTSINGHKKYLICFDDVIDTFEEVSGRTYLVIAFISIIFIILTIAIYLYVPDLLDLQGICIIQSISGLAASYATLIIIDFNTAAGEALCTTLAYIMYFSFLYAFFWLNVTSFHLWRMTVKPKIFNNIKKWTYIYFIFGCVGPTALLSLLIIAHHSALPLFDNFRPGIAEGRCWFSTLKTTCLYFYGPITVLLCCNIIYYVWTIIILWKQMKQSDSKKSKVLKFRICLCIKLFFIMGISWSFEVISAILEDMGKTHPAIWVVTDVLNGLQGLLIFLILVVFRKRVIRGLANRKICFFVLPSKWKTLVDDECEDFEEDLSLSAAHQTNK